MDGGKPNPEDLVDTDTIYRELGLYVVVFQSLHDLLLQICWLLSEPSYGEGARRKLAPLTFNPLVSETGRRVYASLLSQGREESEFAQRFHAALSACRKLGRDRNQIVHSAYVHLESCGKLHGIIRSDMQKGAGSESDVTFDNESLGPSSLDGRIEEIAATYQSLSLCRTQLIHWQPIAAPDSAHGRD